MQFGIDRLENENFARLKGKRVGLFTNLSAVDHNLTPTYDLFYRLDNIQLAALFTPEHGLGAAIHDGVAISSTVDSRTRIPIHSLYGETLAPTAEMMTGIDVMVCDIQDIGVRYYTFLWTLSYILESCGAHHVPVMILDRPNPIGDQIDGGTLAPHLASLVGRFPIPIQHGMTIGELAKMINTNWNLYPAELEVIACIGLHRGMQWPQTGRPFVPPSPNMPHFTTAIHYPGACLIEGTNLSEGRGTALPFEIVGAPFIDSIVLANKLNMADLPGAVPRPHQFIPGTSKFAGKTCGGVQIHVTEPSHYRPLETWLMVLQTIREMYPGEFNWLQPAGGLQHFDRLIGDEKVRGIIDSGETLNSLMTEWSSFHEQFRQQRAPYLIYGEGDGC